MDKKYLLKSTFNVARRSRLLAKAIDLFIVVILSIFLYPLGVILSLIYIAMADGLQDGQSVGKRFIGFSVISLEDGSPCSFKQSFVRNLPIFIPLLFVIIPIWGWLLCFIVGVPIISLELYLLFKLDSGHRLGDVMADTTVMSHTGDGEKIVKRGPATSWFGTHESSS